MRFLYNIFIRAYSVAIRIASLFNHKANLWIQGRQNIFKKIEESLKSNERIIWFHCASLGEFEQGRPLIEIIKKERPNYKILVTFFSPSGYEIRKDYEFADYIFYLPSDTAKNAKRFINLVNPEIAIFVKYEFWFNYFTQIRRKNIPLYLISGVFRPNQHFFKLWGAWQRKQLKNISYFFLQDEKSAKMLQSIGIEDFLVSGDTRFDRVSEILIEKTDLPIIQKFKNGEKLLCAGSSWPPDEDLILDYLKSNNPELKLILAPHDISKNHINEIKTKFQKFDIAVYSETNENEDLNDKQILIIDSIGLLNKIYRYADIAYIGGGFGDAIHNLLEPAVYGIPILYGPNHKHFREAIEMSDGKGGFPIESKDDFADTMKLLLNDSDFYRKHANNAGYYIKSNTGATKLIFEKVFK